LEPAVQATVGVVLAAVAAAVVLASLVRADMVATAAALTYSVKGLAEAQQQASTVMMVALGR